MSTFKLAVNGLHPEISLTVPNSIDEGSELNAEVTLQYPQSNLPVENFEVTWDVQGANILESESITNSAGKAKIKINEIDSDHVKINVSVNGLGFTDLTTKKTINVIQQPISESTVLEKESTGNLFLENNMILFVIPGAACGAFFHLRKTNRYYSLTFHQ